MSDPTPPTALPARPASRRTTQSRAQRLAAQADATAGAAAAARRVIDASFGVVPDRDEASPANEDDVPTRLCVHVSCDVDGPRRATARTEPPHEIDIAVTVRVAEPPTRARRCMPHAKVA